MEFESYGEYIEQQCQTLAVRIAAGLVALSALSAPRRPPPSPRPRPAPRPPARPPSSTADHPDQEHRLWPSAPSSSRPTTTTTVTINATTGARTFAGGGAVQRGFGGFRPGATYTSERRRRPDLLDQRSGHLQYDLGRQHPGGDPRGHCHDRQHSAARSAPPDRPPSASAARSLSPSPPSQPPIPAPSTSRSPTTKNPQPLRRRHASIDQRLHPKRMEPLFYRPAGALRRQCAASPKVKGRAGRHESGSGP